MMLAKLLGSMLYLSYLLALSFHPPASAVSGDMYPAQLPLADVCGRSPVAI
jgi:hypothetical protein